jgi:outer membrane protein TolC
MTRIATLLVALMLGPFADSSRAEGAPEATDRRSAALELIEVLRSVEKHYPLLAAAVEERALAQARLLSRQGAFDLNFKAKGKLKPEGYYETYEGGALLEQPTTFWGAELFGGYRIGSGDFAIWDGGDQTNDGGEFSVGFRLPLLRDRAIDTRRAQLRKAAIEADAAEPLIRSRLLGFSRDAAFAYWDWVAAGMRVSVARQLVDTAQKRQSQLSRRVERGALPTIDLVDNQRLIVDREVRLISAERTFEQAAIDLALFLRDHEGSPLAIGAERLPQRFPEETRPDSEAVQRDIERAVAQQPILQKLDLEINKLEVELALAKNRTLPGLDVSLAGSQDIGGAAKDPDDKGPGVLEAKIEIALPVQRREARGQVAAASARLRQLESERRFARDRIAAEVQKARTALRAAYDQLGATRENVDLARRLRQAEERKLLLGTSNLINVNIRELQAFDAESSLIAAQADYFRALANYRAALGDAGEDMTLPPVSS